MVRLQIRLFLIRRKNPFALVTSILLAVCFCIPFAEAQVSPRADSTRAIAADTVKKNVNNPYFPTFRPQDRYGDPFSNTPSFSPLFLKDPKSLNTDVQIDTAMNYTIFEKIGDVNYRPTSSMTFEEFKQQQDAIMRKTYWQNRSKALDGESAVLANPADDHSLRVFDPAIRGHSDQFLLRFRKPG